MYNYKFKVKYIIYIIILFSIITILLTGCTNNKKETYTLKGDSPLQEEKVTSSYTFKNEYGNYIMFGDDGNYYTRSESEDKFKKAGTYQRYDNMFIVDSYGTKIYQITKDEKNLIFYGTNSYVAIYERV